MTYFIIDISEQWSKKKNKKKLIAEIIFNKYLYHTILSETQTLATYADHFFVFTKIVMADVKE